uniref:Uncharacterized protein n=1 Tax=Oncorhynchus tshawytscha TaxID=74940 RepID=A0AAZ3Q6Y6_ONCTS
MLLLQFQLPPDCAAAPVSTVLPYYYSTMLVIYEHLNILAMFCYNLHPAQPEEDWPPHIAWFLSRLLEEESAKRAELEQIHLQQQRAISQTQAEKQELESERLAKEMALQAAMLQLERLERERHGALEQYE